MTAAHAVSVPPTGSRQIQTAIPDHAWIHGGGEAGALAIEWAEPSDVQDADRLTEGERCQQITRLCFADLSIRRPSARARPAARSFWPGTYCAVHETSDRIQGRPRKSVAESVLRPWLASYPRIFHCRSPT